MGVIEIVSLSCARRATEYRINIPLLESMSQKVPVDNPQNGDVDNLLAIFSTPDIMHVTPDTVSDNLVLPINTINTNTVGISFSVENYPPSDMEVANKPHHEAAVEFLVEGLKEKTFSLDSIPERYRKYVLERLAA